MKLPIPAAALAQHVIALGKTRSGKSSKMRVVVEHLLDEEKPVCIIDPKGDWWGIRSNSDGERRGYPVVIFGGEHADVPLNAHAGAAVAEIIATGNRPALIDLGGWMVGERTRFFIDFASTFFKMTRGQRYLVIDEVHNFAPQGKVFDVDSGKMLHWANRLASEGAGKGVTLIAASQRPQKVHKDFVTSCETLIACRVVHKLDRDAIKDWIDGCADPVIGREVLATLAGMKREESWVWSPEINYGPQRITWPMFRTYDSFKPQRANARALKGWADVDLADVRSKLDSAIKEAEANDPARLRARIIELQRELAKPKELAVDVRALENAERQGLERGIAGAREARARLISCAKTRADELANHMLVELGGYLDGLLRLDFPVDTEPRRGKVVITTHPPVKSMAPATRKAVESMAREAVARVGNGVTVANIGLGNGETLPSVRKILDTIHRSYPVWLTFDAAARRAGISSLSSAYRKYRKLIAGSGELERDGECYRSLAEFAQSGGISTGASISDWAARLPPTYGKMLMAVYQHGPLDRSAIAEHAGVSPTSSGLGTGLRELVRQGLVTHSDGQYFIGDGLE